MSTNVVGVKLQSSGWWGSNSSSWGGAIVSKALSTPAPPASARARSTAAKATGWSGLKGSVGVGDDHIGGELADRVGETGQRLALDLERVVAEIEAAEVGAKIGGRPLGLGVADALDVSTVWAGSFQSSPDSPRSP